MELLVFMFTTITFEDKFLITFFPGTICQVGQVPTQAMQFIVRLDGKSEHVAHA